MPNEVVDSTARSVHPVCTEFYLRIGLGMAMALAIIQSDETLHDDHWSWSCILSLAAEKPR